ncbi:MAG: methionine synthase [Acidobacteriota bacterium]
MSAPTPHSPARIAALRSALEERILVLDGATGTAMQDSNLGPEDFGGEDLDGCNENLCLTRPDVVQGVHRSYLEAGADIVETNTFGGTPLVLAEYDLQDKAYEINRAAAELARRACEEIEAVDGRVRWVCGSVGPTTKAISVTGGVTFEELIENFRAQTMGLVDGGVDYLLLETCQDTRNVKAGLLGMDQAFRELGVEVPVAVSATIETMGTMLGGQDAEALAVSLLHKDLLYVGLNCATGPEQMTDHLRTLSEICRTRIGCVPNAGLPDEDGEYGQTPEIFERNVERFLQEGWINLIGGCCGTTAEHITSLKKLVEGRPPRPIVDHQRALVSGLEAAELNEDNRPLLVGERTNVLGSRAFKKLIQKGDFEAAAEVGRAQVRGGAQIVDVCLQDPDRDEVQDVELFLDQLIRRVKAPLMIDSTDEVVMERALTYCQGKSILNSINLEDGLERFEKVVPLARRYGCALVVGLIDEAGMAVSVERKLEVAQRSFEILTQQYGIEPQDIWWDPLVFPCGTGDENYLGSAKATIDGVREVKAAFPGTKTILGVSNVSFGLPNAGREVLNSVFLYHATRAGLDTAIVNTQKLARYAEIPQEERELAELFLKLELGDVEGGDRAVAVFTEHFRGRKSAVATVDRLSLPVGERLSRSIIEGSKEGLEEDLAEALGDATWPEPLDIINGPLMAGMSEVGRLFNDNELIVAEVLQSAEVMKAAVAFLEPHMEDATEGESEGLARAKVILATVKGDVHDIGKNLVDIILSNNGYEVVNLGIKVPSEQLIQAVREHRPDVVGLSGLLVKSAQQMVTTAGDMKEAGIDCDLIVGGAALTRRFTHKRIAPEYGGVCTYAKDAMHGLALVEQLTGDTRDSLLGEIEKVSLADLEVADKAPRVKGVAGTKRSADVRLDVEVPVPPHTDRHVQTLELDEVWKCLNPQMLYGKHLGLKGSVERLAEAQDEKYLKLRETITELEALGRGGALEARGVWRFFPAQSSGNTLTLFDPSSGDPAAEWTLPRQAAENGLCLTDYVLDSDHVALFVTTAGSGDDGVAVADRVLEWRESGEYLKSHAFAALALETAEAAAEWVHRELRSLWGFPDEGVAATSSCCDCGSQASRRLTPRELFAAKYRGKRYSFGYPACPELADQRQLFAALRPADIGVELTEGDMMDPEASVSALVFHHPDARYFGV